MSYSYFKNKFPSDVFVYVEEFNKQDDVVIFDFIDSNELNLFTNTINTVYSLDKPSMVLLKNYRGRRIQENTIYSIKSDVIRSWQEQNMVNSSIDSLLFGYIIDASKTESEIFSYSVSLDDFNDLWHLHYFMFGTGNIDDLSLTNYGRISITVRNVGQANWNEVLYNDTVKIVYDAGAPMYASSAELINYIGNRNLIYSQSKPILILSHWDKDHYHSLLGMNNVEMQNNFSAFICRDYAPNVTSRKLFGKLSNALGNVNLYSIPAEDRDTNSGPTYFKPLSPLNNQIVIYNAQRHKNRNISGIALSVKTSKGSAILSGDSHYIQISRDILPSLNFKHNHNLIVPHHGGNAGKFVYNKPPLVTFNQAIISVGQNKWKHPFTTNTNALRSSGFSVKETKNLAQDISVPL